MVPYFHFTCIQFCLCHYWLVSYFLSPVCLFWRMLCLAGIDFPSVYSHPTLHSPVNSRHYFQWAWGISRREESQDKYLFRESIKAAPSRKNKKNWHHFITNISLGVWMGCCTLFSVWRHYPRPPSFFLCHILSKASKTERKRGSWILNALI